MSFNEDKWVDHLKTNDNLPPMPWYQLQAMSESDLRSLYLYIVSLDHPASWHRFTGSPARSRGHLTSH